MARNYRRMYRMTRLELQWLNCLEKSELDTSSAFSPKEALEAIKAVPLIGGTKRKTLPHSSRLAFILRKSPEYERAGFRGSNGEITTNTHGTTQWIKVNDYKEI